MKVIAVLFIILALVIGAVPQFTDCASQGRALTLKDGRSAPMKCHWTARAELALAAPLLLTGLFMVGSRRRDALRYMSLTGAFLGISAILLPTSFIGVCANPSMICDAVMKPTLMLSGGLVTVLGLAGTVWSMRQQRAAALALSREEDPA